MAEKTKAKAVETEELSTAELEQKVQEDAGVKIDDGVYKVDLTKPPASEKQPEPEPVKEQPAEEEIKEEPVLEESTEEPVVETEEKQGQRSPARLGDQRREHLLHHRHRGRTPPLPDDGA